MSERPWQCWHSRALSGHCVARGLLPAPFRAWAVHPSLTAQDLPPSGSGPLATQRLARTPGRRTQRLPRDSSPHSIHTNLLPRSWLTGARHDAQ